MKMNRKIKGIVALLLICVFTLSFTSTSYAVTYRTNSFINVFCKQALAYNRPYTSQTFVPTADNQQISGNFVLYGKDTEQYKIYLQKNDGGVWTSTYLCGNKGFTSSNIYSIVEKGYTYRIYIVYTGSVSNFSLEVHENILIN